MNDVRRDFGQRLEHEAPRVHCGMRDSQFVRFYDFVSEQKDVDVDGARALVSYALSSHLLFDTQNRIHELLRSQARFQRQRTIQEPWLLDNVHRLGFVDGRRADHPTDRIQSRLCIPKLPLAVANI